MLPSTDCCGFRYMYHMVNSSLLIGQPGRPAPRQGLAGAKSPRFSILYRYNARRPPTYWFVSNVRAGPHCKAAVKLRGMRHRYRYIVENRVPRAPAIDPLQFIGCGCMRRGPNSVIGKSTIYSLPLTHNMKLLRLQSGAVWRVTFLLLTKPANDLPVLRAETASNHGILVQVRLIGAGLTHVKDVPSCTPG
jgi:hypothetical protein